MDQFGVVVGCEVSLFFVDQCLQFGKGGGIQFCGQLLYYFVFYQQVCVQYLLCLVFVWVGDVGDFFWWYYYCVVFGEMGEGMLDGVVVDLEDLFEGFFVQFGGWCQVFFQDCCVDVFVDEMVGGVQCGVLLGMCFEFDYVYIC